MPLTPNSEERAKPKASILIDGAREFREQLSNRKAKEEWFTKYFTRIAKSDYVSCADADDVREIIRETERRTWEEAKNLAEYHLGWSPTGRTHDFHDGALKQTRMILKEIDARIAALTKEDEKE